MLENHNSYCISRMFLRFCHLTKGPVFSHVDSREWLKTSSSEIFLQSNLENENPQVVFKRELKLLALLHLCIFFFFFHNFLNFA